MAFPPELVFAIGVSGVTARKTGNARDSYNRASQNVARILERWQKESGRSDETLAAAIASSPEAADRLRGLLHAEADAALLNRLEQFVEESTVLIPRAADQFARGDFAGFGETVARSQELAERHLRNQVPETIALARSARDTGALAASAFGAGFGGSVWALVERNSAPSFLDRWQNAYAAECPGPAAAKSAFFLTRPGPGALRV
jgi:galactokinase